MSILYNPILWIIIITMLVVIVAVSVYTGSKISRASPQFKGSVLGRVAEINSDVIIDHLLETPPNNIRAFVVMDNEEYVNNKGIMCLASKISEYMALNSPNIEQIYEMMKQYSDKVGQKCDIGTIIVATVRDDALYLYSYTCNNINEKVIIAKNSYLLSTANYITSVVDLLYNPCLNSLPDGIVLVLNPKMSDFKDRKATTELENNETTDITSINISDDSTEDFGMYTGSLASWLHTHPSSSSVSRYTKKSNPTIFGVNSVNNAVPAELQKEIIPVDLNNRFQTPPQHS